MQKGRITFIVCGFLFLFILSGCGVQKEITPEVTTLETGDKKGTVTTKESPQTVEEIAPTKKEIPLVPQVEWYRPEPGVSWQWQLSGDINTTYDVELYDIDLVNTPQSVIDELHAQNRKVVCYFSAGTVESYRDDAGQFPAEVIGKPLEDWPDERWLDIAHSDHFASIMEKRLDLAVEKKCDGVEPDNIDGYQNDSGFDLTHADQIAYNRWIAQQAHTRGLSVGLKNDLDQVAELVSDFDFAVNEQCFQYDECDQLLPFIQQNKAVLGVEYELGAAMFCDEANELKFSWLKMEYDLDGGRVACR